MEKSDDSTLSKESAPLRPKRSVIERVIVQGSIAVMLVIVAAEGWAYFRLNSVHGALMAEVKKAEATDYRITKKDVDKIFGGRTPDSSVSIKVAASGVERYDLYYFNGLLKKRELCVRYGVAGMGPGGSGEGEPEVVEVSSVVPDVVLMQQSQAN